MDFIKYDEMEFERLYSRLLIQEVNAFFCLVAKAGHTQSEIAERMRERFPGGVVQVIDFRNIESNFVFSGPTLCKRINEGVKILFLANFQLACGALSDAEFFQALNLSRDGLAEFPCVFVFIMPQYFRVNIAYNAPDFNTFFQYHAYFTSPEEHPGLERVTDILSDGYSETNRELLKYYLNKYNGLEDYESKHAFETVLKILDLNASVRSLLFAEHKRFYEKFESLLPQFQNEFERSAFEIANVYDSQGDYAQALLWYEKALAIKEKVLGKEHPDIATIYNNIANVYNTLGDYAKALLWHEKALSIMEKAFGKEHQDTAATYNNIAIVYYKLGDYAKALSWHEKALAIREKVLGKEHPDTAVTYNNIALVYDEQGDYTKALLWFEKALVICEKVLGKEHPDTAATYNNIAIVYYNQGNYEKALEWYDKALPIREKVLGKEHQDTAATYNNIAIVYYKLGDYAKALSWHEKALVIYEKVLGKEHPDIAAIYNNIAIVCYYQGNYDKALEWYEKALNNGEKVLGKEYPKIVAAYNNIALVYDKQGDHAKAFEWRQKDSAANK